MFYHSTRIHGGPSDQSIASQSPAPWEVSTMLALHTHGSPVKTWSHSQLTHTFPERERWEGGGYVGQSTTLPEPLPENKVAKPRDLAQQVPISRCPHQSRYQYLQEPIATSTKHRSHGPPSWIMSSGLTHTKKHTHTHTQSRNLSEIKRKEWQKRETGKMHSLVEDTVEQPP